MDTELNSLEKLYSVSIRGELRVFFIQMSRSGGAKGIRHYVIFQRAISNNILSDGNMKFLLGGSNFVFFTESSFIYYFLRTNKQGSSDHRDDAKVGNVEDTEVGLLRFLINRGVPDIGHYPVSGGDLLKI